MITILSIVTAIAVLELWVIIALSVQYKKKAEEIKYYKPIKIIRKDN